MPSPRNSSTLPVHTTLYHPAVTECRELCIIGGGIIGQTIALRAAMRGHQVTLLERDRPGRHASWAGAGMLPPAAPFRDAAFSELIAASHDLWPDLSAELRERTGLDNGFRRCGGLERCPDEITRDKHIAAWRAAGAPVVALSPDDVRGRCSQLAATGSWFELPTHWQVRNPRHLKALEVACRQLGVEIRSGEAIRTITEGPTVRFETESERYEAARVVIAAGAWSTPLLTSLGISQRVRPIRGQIVLLATDIRLPHIVQDELRYLVPRFDGRLLVGATVEDVGFNAETTVSGTSDLIATAVRLLPALSDARIEHQWAGLRPHCESGPLIGPIGRGVYAATGHYRDGLCLSPITAERVVAAIEADA